MDPNQLLPQPQMGYAFGGQGQTPGGPGGPSGPSGPSASSGPSGPNGPLAAMGAPPGLLARRRFLCSRGFDPADDFEFCPEIPPAGPAGPAGGAPRTSKFDIAASVFTPDSSPLAPTTPRS